MKSRILVCLTVVASALGLAASGVSCDLTDLATCDSDELDLETDHVGDFGTTAAAQKIEAFFKSTVAVQNAAESLANSVVNACTSIGTAIGLRADQMVPGTTDPTDAERIRAACQPVALEIQAVIRAAVPTGVSLSIEYTPAVCSVGADAYANCAADCDVDVTPGSLDVECKPGTVQIGSCEASCTGECWVSGSATCAGSCSARCTGTCSGDCYGSCSGTCDTYGEDGITCAGRCEGDCTGTCTGTCTGRCSGWCTATIDGDCRGECHGSCTDWGMTPPRCEAFARPATVDADCHASCEARLRANVACTNPEVAVNYGVLGGDAAAKERLSRLATALRTNLPDIFRASVSAGEAMIGMVRSFFDALGAIGDSIRGMADAVACVGKALAINAQVTATFSASFEWTAGDNGIIAALDVEGQATVP